MNKGVSSVGDDGKYEGTPELSLVEPLAGCALSVATGGPPPREISDKNLYAAARKRSSVACSMRGSDGKARLFKGHQCQLGAAKEAVRARVRISAESARND